MDVIIYTNEEGGVSVVYPCGGKSAEEVVERSVPEGVQYEIVDSSVLPEDRYFRDAWVKGTGSVSEDLTKSKELSHQRRRVKRAAEFAPHDDIIAKQIPGADAVAAETARAAIRTKYEIMQTNIDAAITTAELKTIVEGGE